jgi:hypothetical protein
MISLLFRWSRYARADAFRMPWHVSVLAKSAEKDMPCEEAFYIPSFLLR